MGVNLDARQRAMLADMRVPWIWPVAEHAINVVAARGDESGDKAQIHAKTPILTPRAPESVRTPDPPSPSGKRVDMAERGWAALEALVGPCTACKLCQGRTQTVFGVGPAPSAAGQPPRVDWLIVGEAPGENEDKQGEPFVGQAGKLLDNMLKTVGLSRSGQGEYAGRALQGAYIANVIKCRPPGNRNPEPAEIAACAPYLVRQIELLAPKMILALGRFAAQTLLAETVEGVQALPLGKLRGRVHRWRGIPVVVSYHPAYLLRSPAEKSKAWADLWLALKTWQAAQEEIAQGL
ncbi:MAG TPA: uracil-DNA glycosylase [Burkholderiaceae bacterium]|nr:uracil-DNA glycosylase [Burkholderiaceae bacterium]